MTGDARSRDNAGPVEKATAELTAWLEQITGTTVLLGDVTGEQPPAQGVWLRPLELRPERPAQGPAGGAAFTFWVRHLVAAADATMWPESLCLLDLVLAGAVRAGEPQICAEPPGAMLWLALGAAPRPALLVDTLARVVVDTPVAPPVLHPLQLRSLEMRSLSGRVLGPGDRPVTGVRVALAGTRTATFTDAQGMFQFTAVPRTGRIRLLLQGRGRSLAAQVEPDFAEPLVIHCHFEES